MPTIKVRHNVEMAHRLLMTPGKCSQIHGHSWWVTLYLKGPIDETGKVAGLEYGKVKKAWRGFLDASYDHKLLLNEHDPYVTDNIIGVQHGRTEMVGDPTTENFATKLYNIAKRMFPEVEDIRIEVWETSTNAAEVGDW